MYINQGWIEALEFVLGIAKENKYFQYITFNQVKERINEEVRKTKKE